MPFVLRKDYAESVYPSYATVTRRFENTIQSGSVIYQPHLRQATQFQTRDEAERLQAMLNGTHGAVKVLEF